LQRGVPAMVFGAGSVPQSAQRISTVNTMPSWDRYSKAVDPRDSAVDQRVRALVQATETFVASIGGILCEWQASMKPAEFARLVDTLGIGRAKVDRLMAAARAAAHPVDELRPSAWWIIFRRPEPIPLLPGEADPFIAAAPPPEPEAFRRRVDLLSADGLAYLLCSLHEPEALSGAAIAVLAAWLEDGGGREEAQETLRSWRTRFERSRHEGNSCDTADGITGAEEAV
jgi:hypothetical protein